MAQPPVGWRCPPRAVVPLSSPAKDAWRASSAAPTEQPPRALLPEPSRPHRAVTQAAGTVAANHLACLVLPCPQASGASPATGCAEEPVDGSDRFVWPHCDGLIWPRLCTVLGVMTA